MVYVAENFGIGLWSSTRIINWPTLIFQMLKVQGINRVCLTATMLKIAGIFNIGLWEFYKDQ